MHALAGVSIHTSTAQILWMLMVVVVCIINASKIFCQRNGRTDRSTMRLQVCYIIYILLCPFILPSILISSMIARAIYKTYVYALHIGV